MMDRPERLHHAVSALTGIKEADVRPYCVGEPDPGTGLIVYTHRYRARVWVDGGWVKCGEGRNRSELIESVKHWVARAA